MAENALSGGDGFILRVPENQIGNVVCLSKHCSIFHGAVVLFVWIESVSVPVEAKSFCQQPVGTFKISKTPGVYRFITCAHQLLAVIQSECKAELFCLGG